ncbi:glycosyltransferase, partial [Desulfovermiculus halophilus]|uniref:glycosyltransferase n=1 Tax=Desulfovermiculus halophilus TaxID=339722 RepID=UPI00048059CF
MMNKKIKVMQLTANLGMGGLERVVINLCKHMNHDVFDVSVCCIKYKGKLAYELEGTGVPVYILQQTDKKKDYTAFWRLKKILSEKKPHLVHTHNANSFIDGALASYLARIPVLINTDHARKFPGRWTERVLEAVLSRSADRFIAVSEETKQNLMLYEKIPERKINVIRNGIDGKVYDIVIDVQKKKEELGLLEYDHLIGLGVRLTQQKGIAHLIEAAPKILSHFPNTGFVVAGKGVLQQSLIALAAQLGVSNHFHFIGPRLDLPEILQVLDSTFRNELARTTLHPEIDYKITVAPVEPTRLG